MGFLRRHPLLLTTALVALLYVADRWLVLAGDSHLLFDANEAEYGFVRVVAAQAGRPLGDVLLDTGARAGFFHDCATVGNQVHGSLALYGTLLLVAVHLGAPLGTVTLKALALGVSTLSIVAWCAVLGRAWRSALAVLVFGLLATLSPVVPLKISLLFWGTHDAVTALFALLLLSFGHRLGARGTPVAAAAWALGAAAAGALFVVANYALGLPAVFLGGWLVLGAAARGAQSWGKARGAAFGLGTALLVTLTFLVVHGLVLRSPLLAGAGLPPGIDLHHALLLGGKQGGPFLFSGQGSWTSLQPWRDDVLPHAMLLAPGPSYGRWWQVLERGERLGLLVLCGWVILRAARRPRDVPPPDRHPLAVFLAAYLPLAFFVISALSVTFELAPGVYTGVTPRYYAHLYPAAFALVAAWAVSGRWWLRLPAVGFALWLGLWEHLQLVDVHNLGALSRYDATRMYFSRHHLDPPPGVRLPLEGASPAFIEGMRFLEMFQGPGYWSWRTPAELRRPIHGEALSRFLAERRPTGTANPDADFDADFDAGIGYALRILVPPSRKALLEPVFSRFPSRAAGIARGYDLPRAELETPPVGADRSPPTE